MTKKIIIALAVIASSVSYAQQAAPQATITQESASLLGARYAQVGFAFNNVNHSTTDAYATGLVVNAPVAKGFDASVGFNHVWQEGNSSNNAQELSVGGTWFTAEGDTKPFLAVDLGYVWSPSNVDNLWVWGSSVGFEYAVNTKTAATVSVGYSGDFESNSDNLFSAQVGGQYVLTKNILAGAAVEYVEGGDWIFSVNATYKF